MTNQSEVRIAIGSPQARRSGVWIFIVKNSDVYISTRSLGGEAKVSLHASGQCQFSRTSKWVTKVPGRRNADRHILKWSLPRQMATTAVNIFHVRIPETELRIITSVEDLTKVQWVEPPKVGETTSLECYITPISTADPTLTSPTPFPCIL